MHDGEKDEHRWQHRNVQHVEAKQGAFAHAMATEEQLAQLTADDGRIAADVGAYRDGPEGQLIPGQQIAGERKTQRQQQKNTPITQLNWRGFLYEPV